MVEKAETAANEQYDEDADDGADLQDFIEPDETPKKIKSTPTALDIAERQLKKQEPPVGRYKRRPRIEEDDDSEVKPNQTPPTKRRRMLEPKSLHMPTGSQQVVDDDDDDDDYDAFAVTVHQPANSPESENEFGGNDDEFDKGDEPIPCPICEHNLIVFQTKTGDDGITCSNSNCAVKIHLQHRYRNYNLQHRKRHPSHLQSTQPTGTLQHTQRGNEDEQCAKRFPTPRIHWGLHAGMFQEREGRKM